jgi:hypothetical protein
MSQVRGGDTLQRVRIIPSRQDVLTYARVGMQSYIEFENARLEREGQFWSKEIVVKIEYKYCPNLTIIDTPGPHTCLLGCGCLSCLVIL